MILKLLVVPALFFSLGLLFASCEKEEVMVDSQELEINNEGPAHTYEVGNNRDKVACTIRDGNGEAVCAGTRCKAPNGDECKDVDNCECIETDGTNGSYPTGMTAVQFKQLWNTESGRQNLMAQGYYSTDN